MAVGRALFVIGPLLIILLLGASPTLAQEFITRGPSPSPALAREAGAAVRYSLESLAGLGAALDPPPKIYLAGTRRDCEEIHVELGWSRTEGQRRCSLLSDATFPGVFLINLEHIAERHRDPTTFIWWVVPHAMFHMYQWQTGVLRIGSIYMPIAFQEAPADMHKLKVLHERRIINMEAYVRQILIPRAKAGRVRWNISILSTRVSLTAQNTDDHYFLWATMGYYLFLNGGWPKLIPLNGSSSGPFPERFQTIYGRTLEEFEREFFAWLDRQ